MHLVSMLFAVRYLQFSGKLASQGSSKMWLFFTLDHILLSRPWIASGAPHHLQPAKVLVCYFMPNVKMRHPVTGCNLGLSDRILFPFCDDKFQDVSSYHDKVARLIGVRHFRSDSPAIGLT